MAKLTRVTAAEVLRALAKRQFAFERQKGSHRTLKDPQGRRVLVPIHAGKILSLQVLKSILRDAELSVEEFIRLLKDP
jgi:predicted RNA binding protein YcfA (HicA-like mRNA interferase family)